MDADAFRKLADDIDDLAAAAARLAPAARELRAHADALDTARFADMIAGYREAAEYLDEDQDAFRSAVRRGAFPSVKIGGRYYFTRKDLDARKAAQIAQAGGGRNWPPT